jgi:hypothetical protein
MDPPKYPGTSLRDDLLALLERAGSCDDRPKVVTATMEMARSHPDLYRTLSERYGAFVRLELDKLARQSTNAGAVVLSEIELDVLSETVTALLAHYAGPAGGPVPRERLIRMVDQVLMVLMTGARGSK